MRRLVRFIVMLVIVGAIGAGVYFFIQYKNQMIAQVLQSRQVSVIQVGAVEAEQVSWQTTVPAIGTLRAGSGTDVTPSVAGVIEEIFFESGNTVEQGAPILRLDSDIQEANLAAAQANLDLAEANYNRTRSLEAGTVVSQATLDQNLYQMQAQQAQVAALNAEIDKKTVRAPFSGRLGIRQVDLGQYIQPGTAIVNLQDLTTLNVEFSVTQRDIDEVVPGRPIRVTTDAWVGETFVGEVTSTEPRVDPGSGQVTVEGNVPNENERLLPGMFVNVEIELADSREVTVVPEEAVSYNLYGDYIYVVRPKEGDQEHPTVQRVTVKAGPRRDGNVVIEEGVAPGDLVVTSGQLKLSNGTAVEVTEGAIPDPDVENSRY
ncbi:efflux RND transporter periplasmic adaptor subunit [Lutibaculum baratangense]|uniref:Putative Co/Zn/Cd efflux system membrane fusion protein n=1 Tax=Lutibaculum baratangense AMV1 TaxID=631454 RepID=V4RJG8_9HYPH|nr:efflux RND transporter periplasmic adaptor subunit [Lutibaculum baratangense]ESR26246.1 putative Co/Zn/Cd efflux system membrane fusion protein [Lutibaculum baratangense AMV1]